MSHATVLIEKDILAYLDQHENKDLLRFLTCGSVDDGKSTLIGRLLFDSKLIFEDHLVSLHKDNERQGNAGESLDLALLVDGLASEREQGITIDVAYRYFSTDKRKFIIADCPGHEQYTRNMATGASTCDLAVMMIDARKGVLTQSRRHSFIVSLLGLKHIVVAINKMDLVDFSEEIFNNIREQYQQLAAQLGLEDLYYVPISALNGDNVVNRSESTPWYHGETLMSILEQVELRDDQNVTDLRFPVQFVNRPNPDFRGYCGTLASGVVHKGDEVAVLPSGKTTRVKGIHSYEGEMERAWPGDAVTLTLEDEVDVSRGDLLVHANNQPAMGHRFAAHLVWMSEQALTPGREYGIKIGTRMTNCYVNEVLEEIDVNTLERNPDAQGGLGLNAIGLCDVELSEPVVVEDYQHHPGTGSFILIDKLTNVTVAAGMVARALDGSGGVSAREYTKAERNLNRFIRENYPEWGCEPV
ncbi:MULTISPECIES: sulfate adenylyltransferase subunit CysN [unclassified Marinobacter]|uniref:sulfate adenylyltransferase subunit CysN n=1 Tax=unclassified Marinobacter TaxID=83889 RepID=UPI0020102915|nr:MULTISPECIES: sulfate adenylyltransferase subunit CysN [unclassified Marinobacter]MCL1481490.1 sulfate adenylyltransferase subunit CysN [Marinobacter sp.]UQG54458.1 sulfate adenylyltransferase subunit CysN [Marinobacter sp. M4C]UQG63263.1 sulfate adenylyltransferase subunit CysN [Marinobacter sp. M2C]UQG67543.1 sulfate adenylyltransferase subunit CysN [Marinobacter sp. M1C]